MTPILHALAEWDGWALQESHALRWEPLTALFVVASAWWVKWPLFVAVGAWTDAHGRRRIPDAAVCAAMSAAGAAAVVGVLKDAFDRLRPALADPAVTALVATPDSPSFPSGHSATAFAAATAVGAFAPRLRLPLLALAALVALSRVYLGVHYWLDVLVGATLGVAVGLAAAALVRRARAARRAP